MVQEQWMDAREMEKAERFSKIRQNAIKCMEGKSAVRLTRPVTEFVLSVNFCTGALNPDPRSVILEQVKKAQEEAGEEVAKAELELNSRKAELQQTEISCAKAKEKRMKCESAIRNLYSERKKEKDNMKGYIDLYSGGKKDLWKKSEDFRYYKEKINQINSKKFVELIFRPDIVFPIAGKEEKIKSLRRECDLLENNIRNLYHSYCDSFHKWLSLELDYRLEKEQAAEEELKIKKLQERLMNESKVAAYWLEWYVLYGIFRIYLESQESSLALDRILTQIGEEVPLLGSYDEVKEALSYWKEREENLEYLKCKIKSLQDRAKG